MVNALLQEAIWNSVWESIGALGFLVGVTEAVLQDALAIFYSNKDTADQAVFCAKLINGFLDNI